MKPAVTRPGKPARVNAVLCVAKAQSTRITVELSCGISQRRPRPKSCIGTMALNDGAASPTS